MADTNATPTLQQAVENFASDLAQKLQGFVNDITTLEVRTYTIKPDQIPTDFNSKPDINAIMTQGKAALMAYTNIAFDGDTTVMVPTDDKNAVNTQIWDLHQTSVKQAQENRAVMIKAIGDAAVAALNALGLARTTPPA
ncbi:MAG TPA: hypothetical protein VGA61_00665 [Anaerolineae bacterium]